MWNEMEYLFASIIIVIVTLKILLYIAARDKEVTGYSLDITNRLLLLGILSGELVFWCGSRYLTLLDFVNDASIFIGERKYFLEFIPYVAMGILAACLLMACVTDCQNCQVYHYVWWVGSTAGSILMMLDFFVVISVSRCSYACVVSNMLPQLSSIFIFWLLQEKMFSKMYGKADCHAFVVCAMAECALGLTLKEYLIHMLLAVFLLAVIQGIKRNIGRNGNLKKSVPFLPYITVSFWGLLLVSG